MSAGNVLAQQVGPILAGHWEPSQNLYMPSGGPTLGVARFFWGGGALMPIAFITAIYGFVVLPFVGIATIQHE